MDRINGAGTIDIGGGRRGFRSEDLPSGTEGTEVTDSWLNAVQENILKVIEEAGLTLDVDNWSLLWQAIRFSQMADGYFSVTDRRNDPPGAPAVGDRYIVGGVPTGAWVGHENKIALWLGVWTFIAPTPWMHVGFADRTDWRWDHTIGVPAWVQWKAEATIAGPITLDQILATSGGAALTAATVARALNVGLSVPNTFITVAPITVFSDDGQGDWVQSGNTIVCLRAGRYMVFGSLGGIINSGGLASGITFGARKNGTELFSASVSLSTTVIDQLFAGASDIVDFEVDDVLEMWVYQGSGATKSMNTVMALSLFRVTPL